MSGSSGNGANGRCDGSSSGVGRPGCENSSQFGNGTSSGGNSGGGRGGLRGGCGSSWSSPVRGPPLAIGKNKNVSGHSARSANAPAARPKFANGEGRGVTMTSGSTVGANASIGGAICGGGAGGP